MEGKMHSGNYYLSVEKQNNNTWNLYLIGIDPIKNTSSFIARIESFESVKELVNSGLAQPANQQDFLDAMDPVKAKIFDLEEKFKKYALENERLKDILTQRPDSSEIDNFKINPIKVEFIHAVPETY